MKQAARVLVLVAMLPARAGSATKPIHHDISFPECGGGVRPTRLQHGNRHRRRMNSSTSLGRRNTLQAVAAGLAVERLDAMT